MTAKNELVKKIDILNGEVQKLYDYLQKKQTTLANLKKNQEVIQSRLDENANSIQRLEKAIQDITVDNDKKDNVFEQNVNIKRAEVEKLQAKIKSLDTELLQLNSEKVVRKFKSGNEITKNEAEIKHLQNDQKNFSAELALITEELKNLEQQINALVDKQGNASLIKKKEEEKKQLETELRNMENDQKISMLNPPKRNDYSRFTIGKALENIKKKTDPKTLAGNFTTPKQVFEKLHASDVQEPLQKKQTLETATIVKRRDSGAKTPSTAQGVAGSPINLSSSGEDAGQVIDLTSSDDSSAARTPEYFDSPRKTVKFGVLYDEAMLKHEAPKDVDVYEKPERIKVIYERLVEEKFFNRPDVVSIQSRKATNAELLLCHDQKYIDKVAYNIKNNVPFTKMLENDEHDEDMFFKTLSLESIYYAAGCAAELADAFLAGQISSGVAIVRPPGHHASHNHASGFCFFNNAAICAIKLANAGKRVLIVDYDCHLGDGTMDILAQLRPNNDLLRYYSIHRWDKGQFFPHGDIGASTPPKSDDRITLVGFNLKGKPKKDDAFYIQNFKERFDERIFKWMPDVIVLSAGFDAEVDDLGGCKVTKEGYREITKIMHKFCPNILMVLEGGYNLDQLPDCSFAAIDTLEKLK